jgi:hypothetical protein
VNGDRELQAMNIRYEVAALSIGAGVDNNNFRSIVAHDITSNPEMYICVLTVFVIYIALNIYCLPVRASSYFQLNQATRFSNFSSLLLVV